MPETLLDRRRSLIGLAACWFGLSAAAAEVVAGVPAAGSASAPALTAELLKTGLYLISGGGGNSLLRLSQSGAVLVDGKAPGQYPALMAQIRRISRLSDLPVRVLIASNHHDAHAGNAQQFMAAGVALIAQQNTRRRLPPGVERDDSAKATGRVVVFDRAYQLHIGGVDVNLYHFGPAHTDNDVLVHFPDLRVVALGELVSVGAPVPDYAAGGRLLGWGPVLGQVLQLDVDLVVPGSGPVMSRAELAGFKARVDALSARATGLVKQGIAKDRLLQQLSADDPAWSTGDLAAVLDPLFAELSAAP